MVTAERDAPTDPIPLLLLVATLDRGGADQVLAGFDNLEGEQGGHAGIQGRC